MNFNRRPPIYQSHPENAPLTGVGASPNTVTAVFAGQGREWGPSPGRPSGRRRSGGGRISAGWPRGARRLVTFYCVLFALYALFGKGFAYLGVRPVYIGEIALVIGIAATIFSWSRSLGVLLTHRLGILLIALATWGLFRTIPYLGAFGTDALRDAMLWGYSAFALVAGVLTLRLPGLLPEIQQRYTRFGKWYIFLGPILAILTELLSSHLPRWPGTDVTIPDLKETDLCIHLAGIACFVMLRLGGRTWWFIPIFAGTLAAGAETRGGLVAFAVAFAVVLALRPDAVKILLVIGTLTAVFVALLIIDPHIKIHKGSREISASQVVENVSSVGSHSSSLENTTEWRIRWWKRILDYTVFGQYFWTGKGYGVNLAVSDGIANNNSDLRSPHNAHLNFLARSGVPGFLLWAVLQFTWAGLMLSSRSLAKSIGAQRWASLFTWIFAYWIAFIVNAAFDVSLEGPMNAIPFWMVFGLGWGGHIIFRRQMATRQVVTRQIDPKRGTRRGRFKWAPPVHQD